MSLSRRGKLWTSRKLLPVNLAIPSANTRQVHYSPHSRGSLKNIELHGMTVFRYFNEQKN